MNTLLALIYSALSFAASQGNPEPEIIYVPVGTLYATASACVTAATAGGAVLYCAAENKIVVMATNNNELVD